MKTNKKNQDKDIDNLNQKSKNNFNMNKIRSIVILSGKGGVGKSTITSNIILALNELTKGSLIAVDCDVDASNLSLVLNSNKLIKNKSIFASKKAVIDYSKCDSNKRCYETCSFNAIDWINNKPVINTIKCEGCNVCAIVCPNKAIKMKETKNANLIINKLEFNNKKQTIDISLKNLYVVSGQLLPGSSGSGKIVDIIKQEAYLLAQKNKFNYLILDSAAGISCPVISSVNGSDLALIVLEPTPSSLSDMKRAIKIVESFNIPFYIIINKSDISDKFKQKIIKYVEKKKYKIILQIPYDKIFLESLIKLNPLIAYTKYRNKFIKISKQIINKLNNK